MQTIRRIACTLIACTAFSAWATDTTTSTTTTAADSALKAKCEKLKSSQDTTITKASLAGQLTGNSTLTNAAEWANSGCDKLSVDSTATSAVGTAVSEKTSAVKSAVSEKTTEVNNIKESAQSTGSAIKGLFK